MYCKHCASEIDDEVIVCPKCGKQVGELQGSSNPNIVINNSANANATATAPVANGKAKNKMTAIILCCLGFVGLAGFHKIYESKFIMGLVYFFTFGIFGIGTILDLIALLGKPNTYYV